MENFISLFSAVDDRRADMADFGQAKEQVLRLEHGIPSHDTFSRVFRLLDPARFAAAFRQFMAAFAVHRGLSGVVASDGNAMRDRGGEYVLALRENQSAILPCRVSSKEQRAMAVSKSLIVVDQQLRWDILEPRGPTDSFVAVCKQLGLSVEAPNREELEARAIDAVNTLEADLMEHKDLLQFLDEHGFNYRIEQIQRSPRGFVTPTHAFFQSEPLSA
jgi:hypothetical protein